MITLNNRKPLILAVVAVVAFVMLLSPTLAVSDVLAKEKKKKSNDSDQEIEQDQDSRQNSQCVAGDSILASCNNLSFQDQDNDGNNAAGQQSGDGKKGKKGNDGDQGIEQEQENNQNAQCVSGEEAIVSCNQLSFQGQDNEGNNALGQD